jgi:hypothetical protein
MESECSFNRPGIHTIDLTIARSLTVSYTYWMIR